MFLMLNVCFQNDNAMEWIRKLAWKSADQAFMNKVPILFNELEKNPVGMGKGQFMINESFIFRVS